MFEDRRSTNRQYGDSVFVKNDISIKEVDMDISIASTVSIRESGLDEYWLQDQIYENPTCLGLGDLESVTKESLH